MKSITKVAVIGGTGKAGQYLLQHLINRGISCNVLLRNFSQLPVNVPNVEIIRGDARDYEAVDALVQGCQAVISTLGQPQNEPPIFSQATAHILRAMEAHRLRRYILIAGLNVDAHTDEKSLRTKSATDWMKTHYPATTLDKQAEYNVLIASKVDWTLVRLPLIELTGARKGVRVSLRDCPGETISATDLAHFLVRQLSDDQYHRQAPFIAS